MKKKEKKRKRIRPICRFPLTYEFHVRTHFTYIRNGIHFVFFFFFSYNNTPSKISRVIVFYFRHVVKRREGAAANPLSYPYNNNNFCDSHRSRGKEATDLFACITILFSLDFYEIDEYRHLPFPPPPVCSR